MTLVDRVVSQEKNNQDSNLRFKLRDGTLREQYDAIREQKKRDLYLVNNFSMLDPTSKFNINVKTFQIIYDHIFF